MWKKSYATHAPRPISIFYFCRFALPIVFGIAGFVYIWFINDHGLSMQMKIGVVVFAFAAGFYGPNLYLENMITKRRTSIMRAFPDSLDMMLICVESGMSIEAAFKKVMPELMRGAAKGVVHKKTVSRKLSRLSARIKGIAA